MKKKKAYVIFTHHFLPSKKYKDKHEAHEVCEFVEYLKNRQIDSATAIVELVEKKLVKNRVQTLGFDDYIEYLYKSYPDKMKAIVELLGISEEYKKYSEEFLQQEVEVSTMDNSTNELGSPEDYTFGEPETLEELQIPFEQKTLSQDEKEIEIELGKLNG